MIFLAQSLAPWIAAALALGLVFGLRWNGAAATLILLYLAAVAVAALGLAPGRGGFWLDSALLVFGAYGFGAAGASLLRTLFGGSRKQARIERAPPDWIGPANDYVSQAASFSIAAPRAAATLDAARAALAHPGAEPPCAAASEPEAARFETETRGKTESSRATALAGLNSIHGLDEASACFLRGRGVESLDDLARLAPSRILALARELGRAPALLDYWAAQARLLVNGFATEFSRGGRVADWEVGAPDEAAALALLAALPQPAAPGANDALYPGERPFGLLSPPDGADDLHRIEGVDDSASETLNRLGVWTFRQIAAWSPDNVRWIDSWLAAPGRVGREGWRQQAASLAAGARDNNDR
jgi:predicted flap endonuclease-1-like 5' DNA nuclease